MGITAAREWIAKARRVVGFTGAGISTESGIPDFRSPGGVWSTARMIEYSEFLCSREARIEAWRQKSIAWPAMRDAIPNAGHHAFVELERRGKLTAMITQNIDGLHRRAGQSPELVIELHGTMAEAMCLECGDRIPMDDAVGRVARGELAPECELCAGMLKAATVSFGQPMPAREVERAIGACEACDLLIAVGSSLVVYPAASLPALAKQSGARLIVINRTETPLDGVADLALRDEIGRILPQLIG